MFGRNRREELIRELRAQMEKELEDVRRTYISEISSLADRLGLLKAEAEKAAGIAADAARRASGILDVIRSRDGGAAMIAGQEAAIRDMRNDLDELQRRIEEMFEETSSGHGHNPPAESEYA